MRLFYLIRKEFIEIFRQREMVMIIFIAPILQTILLGYVVTTDVKNIPVQIVNLSRDETANHIADRINRSPLFNVKKISRQPDNYQEIFRQGKVKAIIILRDGFVRKSIPPAYPEIQILMDGIDSNTAGIAAGYFNGITRQYFLSDLRSQGLQLPLESKTLIRFNPRLKSITYMGPGIVALLLTIVTMFLTSISLVREKEQQTMDTLLISRLTPLEIYMGKALPMAIIGLAEMFLGVLVVILVFDITMRGSIIWLLLSAVVFLFATLSYALFISTLCTSQQQALFFSWFSMVTFLLLSGLFTPIENIPEALQWLVAINPLRYLIQIIREIFLKGNGPEFFFKDLLSMSVIAIVMISFSLLNFKRMISR